MFLRLNRILPGNVHAQLVLNTDQIVWAQPDSNALTVAIMPVTGPEIIVANDEAATKLLSGLQ